MKFIAATFHWVSAVSSLMLVIFVLYGAYDLHVKTRNIDHENNLPPEELAALRAQGINTDDNHLQGIHDYILPDSFVLHLRFTFIPFIPFLALVAGYLIDRSSIKTAAAKFAVYSLAVLCVSGLISLVWFLSWGDLG